MGLKPVNFPVKTNPLTDIFPENSKGPIGPESDSMTSRVSQKEHIKEAQRKTKDQLRWRDGDANNNPSDLGQDSPGFRSKAVGFSDVDVSFTETIHMGMDQYLLIPFLGEWTSILTQLWLDVH